MVRERFDAGVSVDKTQGGYCGIGRLIKLFYGPASQQFAAHVNFCHSCDIALTREQNAMRRDAAADRRQKGER